MSANTNPTSNTVAVHSQIRNILTSPIRGTAVPSSPAKVSLAVRQSLAAMNTVSKSPLRFGYSISTSPRLVSPSITKWFQKQNITIGSPMKPKSPRRLVVTPKKVSSPMSSSPSLNTEKHSEAHTHPVPRGSSVKRKLNSGDDLPERRAKRARICSQNENNVSNSLNSSRNSPANKRDSRSSPANRRDSRSSPSSNRILVNYNKPKTPKLESVKKSLFEDKLLGVKAMSSDHDTYQSPTLNLPNYVVNPQPRTPVGKNLSTPDGTPDWLTRMKLGRDSTGSPSDSKSPRRRTPRVSRQLLEPSSPASPATLTTPKSSRKKKSAEATTPTQRSQTKTSQQNTPVSRTKDSTPVSRQIVMWYCTRVVMRGSMLGVSLPGFEVNKYIVSMKLLSISKYIVV